MSRAVRFGALVPLLAAALFGCRPSTSTRPARADDGADASARLAASSDAHPATSASRPERGPSVPPMQIAPPRGLTPRPVVALYERNPWLDVIGSDVPSVILYADDTCIRARAPSDGTPEPTFVEGKVGGGLVAELERLLAPLPETFTAFGATDQRTTTILLETERGWIRRSIYGLGSNCTPRAGTSPPEGFIAACRALHDREATGEHAFDAPQLEVMLWGFEHAREPPVPWPSDLPAPPKGPPGELIHHVLPGRYLPKVRSFQASLGRRPVGFDGHKWSMRVRAVLPGDGYLARVNTETRRAELERDRAK